VLHHSDVDDLLGYSDRPILVCVIHKHRFRSISCYLVSPWNNPDWWDRTRPRLATRL